MIPILLKLKPVGKFLGSAIRGIAKGNPTINAIVEAYRKKKGVQMTTIGPDGQPIVSSHSWVSIIFQAATAIFLLYMFFSGKLNKDDMLELMAKLMEFFSNAG